MPGHITKKLCDKQPSVQRFIKACFHASINLRSGILYSYGYARIFPCCDDGVEYSRIETGYLETIGRQSTEHWRAIERLFETLLRYYWKSIGSLPADVCDREVCVDGRPQRLCDQLRPLQPRRLCILPAILEKKKKKNCVHAKQPKKRDGGHEMASVGLRPALMGCKKSVSVCRYPPARWQGNLMHCCSAVQ